MPNIEVLSLSFNKINQLQDLASCSKLRELYMRKNLISDLREIKYLVDCHNLKTLWLAENPCSSHKDYRLYIIKHLTFLERLDNDEVTVEER
jgi:Leucine-rich repeat (LRR) protein